nr:unnamed protein product [Spirometra erinaceieuropaei]
MDDWGSQPMKVRTEDWKCRWPLLAGHRRTCRLWKANHGRLEEPTMEGAEGRLRELTIVESQPWTTGNANHERHGRKTGSCSAGSRYWPVIEGTVDCGEPTVDDWESQP